MVNLLGNSMPKKKAVKKKKKTEIKSKKRVLKKPIYCQIYMDFCV